MFLFVPTRVAPEYGAGLTSDRPRKSFTRGNAMRRLDGKVANVKFRDLTGVRFGSLTAISTPEKTAVGQRRVWLVRCDCGVEKVLNSYNLTNGHTLSCGSGCRKSVWTEDGLKRKREAQVRPGAAFRQLLLNYKSAARKRNLPWELPDEQFRRITSSPCFYTGKKPATESVADSGEIYVYNGVDRVDNSLGYTVENCVSCCAEINMMKKILTKERFIELCKAVAERF